MGENTFQRHSWCISSSIQPFFLSQLFPSTDLAVAVYLVLTGVTSVLGNSVVLLFYFRKRKKLRPAELLTANLALCDLGFSLLGMPFFIISSVCHAWVFGETGCLWYGIQGFVFRVGSLLTTCLISLDRCLKICCLRYGQWIEMRHVSLSIAMVWVYTLFLAFLPAFGFGSYGPEPYGSSCTINWWRMTSSTNDRIYIFLILILCFGFPMLIIVTSYVVILLMILWQSCCIGSHLTLHVYLMKWPVCRSNRTLASIPLSFVRNSRKDLKLTKMAAVVCTTFLLAWMPYATVSLISALIPRDDQEAESLLQTTVSNGMASSHSPVTLNLLNTSSLLDWTTTEYYRQIFYNPEEKRSDIANMNPKIGPSKAPFRSTSGPQPFSSLPPVVTLIPVMLAKSHCMINPFIYQIMNREFREDIYMMVFGREKAERRRVQSGRKASRGRNISLSSSSGRRRGSHSNSLSHGKKKEETQEQKDQ